MANEYKYRGLSVIQQPGAPTFYMTAVSAVELLEWCDVPRAKGDYMAGYQRILDPKRTGDLANYLRLSPKNIVPGAVIVAVDAEYIDVDDEGAGFSSITVRPDDRDFRTKLEELWGSFTTRLTDEELGSAGIEFSVAGDDSTPDPDSTSVDLDGAVGNSELEDDGDAVVTFEDDGPEEPEDDADADSDATYPASYLAALALELTAAVEDWDSVPADRRKAIEAYIDGASKPGLIIDGQHRVFGAKDVSEHDVVLPVVLLPGLAFSEQVFQFYVLNSKAKPLRPTELRRIVSTSLTNAEILELYQRFKAAGIEAEEARWTLEISRQPDSPFRSRIDFGYGESGAEIPENVADQVVRAFMKMPRSRYRQLTDPLGPLWLDIDNRLQIFLSFWNAIKSEYSETWAKAETMADKGEKHQLFYKVSLLTLQSFLLDHFVTALPYRNPNDDPPLQSKEELKRMVNSTLTNLPGEFFEREWKVKQIDTSEGRKVLYGAMEFVWNNQGKLHGNMHLFRG
jgi:hypothetical protein